MRRLWLVFLMGTVLLTGVLALYRFQTPARQQTGCSNIAAQPDYLSTESEADAIAAIDYAHSLEGLSPLHLPAHFYRLGPVRQQFVLLNLERAARHIAPLHLDANLSQVAFAYSQQLLNLHFFSHTSPISGTFGERIDANPTLANHYALAAENLAGNPVPGAGAMYEYMYDDAAENCGHRDTILNPALKLVGIGWLRGGPYGSVSVQEFLSSASWNPYTGARPDTRPPRITLRISRSSFSLLHCQAFASDNVGVVRITWFLDHLSARPAVTGSSWMLDLHHLASGSHTILAYAVDGEQNYGVARYVFTVPS